MFSLLTNTASMTALRSLQATQRELDVAEKQLATGLRISEASDNPAIWSISVSMKAQLSSYGAKQDGLNLEYAGLTVAQAGINSVLSSLNGIQKDMVTATQPGIDRVAVQQDITARQNGIRSIIGNATFNGVSQLSVDFSFTSGGASYNALSVDVSSLSTDAVKSLSGDFNQVVRQATNSGVDIGSRLSLNQAQRDFYSTLSDAITTGIGSLVDADMNLVSTRIQALKTQQQLGIIALSIANDNSKLILKLFGG